MKNIVITGTNGYIANKIKDWLPVRMACKITMLSVRGDLWRSFSWSGVDCVIHTAALVHENESGHTLQEYEDVNCLLTKELAVAAKAAGVPHFVYISSMAVYGSHQTLFRENEITADTPCNPVTKYGISKLHAENELSGLATDTFKVALIRPPFVYGPGCPGNYNSLKKLVLGVRIIPKIQNRKSMIYIDNLCELIRFICELQYSGVFCPQNRHPVGTYELAALIAKYNNVNMLCSAFFNPFVYLGSLISHKLRKAFCSEYYAAGLSELYAPDETNETDPKLFHYCVCDLEESVKRTEKRRDCKRN